MFGRNMTLLALQKPGAPNFFTILRPNTGESFFDMEVRSRCQVMLQIASWEASVLGPQVDFYDSGIGK